LYEQVAVTPPPLPTQLHVVVPLLVARPETVPVVHLPDELPQAPLTDAADVLWAEQSATEPPFAPLHVHVHGPLPLTLEAEPVLQRLVVGLEPKDPPLDDPQAPLPPEEVEILAEHVAVEPPLFPSHVQIQGPSPSTSEVVPALQRFVFGAVLIDVPLADPQAPFVVAEAPAPALQEADSPSFLPSHVHVHGPSPSTSNAVPVLHRFRLGFRGALVVAAAPHFPSTDRLLWWFR
jgi:hypothetical protein